MGAKPGPEASVRKLLGVEHDQRVQEVGLSLLGPEGATRSATPPAGPTASSPTAASRSPAARARSSATSSASASSASHATRNRRTEGRVDLAVAHGVQRGRAGRRAGPATAGRPRRAALERPGRPPPLGLSGAATARGRDGGCSGARRTVGLVGDHRPQERRSPRRGWPASRSAGRAGWRRAARRRARGAAAHGAGVAEPQRDVGEQVERRAAQERGRLRTPRAARARGGACSPADRAEHDPGDHREVEVGVRVPGEAVADRPSSAMHQAPAVTRETTSK